MPPRHQITHYTRSADQTTNEHTDQISTDLRNDLNQTITDADAENAGIPRQQMEALADAAYQLGITGRPPKRLHDTIRAAHTLGARAYDLAYIINK